MDESKDYHQAIDEIEYNLGLKTENQACPREAFSHLILRTANFPE
jgi:hypothetical protein